jgi:predicted transglutaminase-like cysteine proteinase
MKLVMDYKIIIISAIVIIIWLSSGCVAPKELQTYFNTQEAQAASISASIPIGPGFGNENQQLTFTTDCRSSLGGNITYGFSWGDGSYNWEKSGLASHSWTRPGIYLVRAQAVCGDSHSEWSKCKVVMIGSAAVSRSPLNTMDKARTYVKFDDDAIKALLVNIKDWAQKWSYNDFDAIREWVTTNIAYQSDSDLFHAGDYWQFPVEIIENGAGDCEDIAILLCSLLRAAGVPPEEVYVAVGTIKGTNDAHAYLFEHKSKGVWRVIEPQVSPILSNLTSDMADWVVTADYSSKLTCFNDKYVFAGLPTTAAGVYEFGVDQSFWPFTAAGMEFRKQLKKNDTVIGYLKWIGVESILFDYEFKILGPQNNLLMYEKRKDIDYSFTAVAPEDGTYRIQVLKHDFAPRYGRMKLNPAGWGMVKIDNGE